MSSKSRFFPSSFNLLLRVLVAAVFFAGVLPAPALAGGNGTIAGHISDNATGGPSPNSTVYIFTAGSPSPVTYVNTDGNGDYTVGLTPGSGYEVEARAAGFVTQRAIDQTVISGNTTVVNFSLLRGGIIRGTISDNLSGPIEGAFVRAYRPENPEAQFFAPPSASNGAYNLTALPGAGYVVVAEAPGYASANKTVAEVAVSQLYTVDFTLQTGPPQDDTPPAAITDLATANVTHDSVVLTWTAPGDDNVTGQAAQYDIRFAASVIDDNGKFDSAQAVPDPPPPHAAATPESFVVGGLSANTTYFFAIKTRDDAGHWSGLSNSPSARTGPQPLVPDFNIAHSQGRSSFMLAAGANITETFNVSSINGFEGTVNLGLGGPPEIASNSGVSPTQVALTAGQTQAVTLTIGAGPMMPSGTYQCGLNGQTPAYGGRQKGFFFTVIIGVPGQPLLSASPPMVTPGGPVDLFASQFPPSANITIRWDSGPNKDGVVASGQTAPDGTWDVQVTIPADMPGGNFALRATSGPAMAVCQLTVTSGAGPDYLLSASPQFVSLMPGQSANVTVYVTSVNGFSAAVGLTAGTAPGVIRGLSAGSVTPAAGETVSSVLSIAVADWASPNMYQLNVEGACADPPINKVININLDIQPPAEWGPGISLSQSYAREGDTITMSGANFPPACEGETVTVKEAFSNTTLTTSPATITISDGGFTGTFTIPTGIPSGNYRIRAVVQATGDFAERDFQILGTGDTFSLNLSPSETAVTTEEGNNSSSVSVNIFSMGGSSPSVGLALEGAPPWLTYRFGSLPDNTPASGDNAITVPAGGSASRDLHLTASLTAPTGTYPITVRGWVDGGAEQRVPLELTVQPPAGFGMAQVTLSPNFGAAGQNVNFSGSGFTGCDPSQVTEITFGQLDLITGQGIPTINVPTTGDPAGRFSGTFRVPAVLPPGTYPVKFRVGTMPNDKFMMKPFTITGPGDTFVLQASPAFLWTEQGTRIHTMIKVQAVGSSSPTVSLALEGLPPDITTSFESASITAPPGGFSGTDLGLEISPWLTAGHYTITVRGQLNSGAETHRFPLELDVAPPAGMGISSIYLSPNVGPQGTWITISGSGFPAGTPLTHLYFGPPIPQNDRIGGLPSIGTDESGAFTAVIQVPPGLMPGMYPVQVVVGTYPDDRIAVADFSLVGDQASFNINLSPNYLQVAPGTSANVSVNIQSVGTSSANVSLSVEGPPAIEWRFDGGTWQMTKAISPAIGSSMTSNLEIRPKPSLPMGHYSMAVKAVSGDQIQIRNLDLDVGASAAYGMPIFSLNPNTGTAGTSVSFSGSNFPPSAPVTGLTFAGANITLGQAISTSAQGSFSGAFTSPGDQVTYELPGEVNGLTVAVTVTANATAGGAPGEIEDSVIGSRVFDDNGASDPDVIHVSGDIYAIAYAGSGGGYLETLEITADGQIAASVSDTLVFYGGQTGTPAIIHVSGDTYAIAYQGSGHDGFIATVAIAAGGQVNDSVIDTLMFDGSLGGAPDIAHVSGNIFAIAYQGSGNHGYVKTYSIDVDGQIGGAVDALQFDTGNGREPDIIYTSGDIYAIAYRGDANHGFLRTVSISPDGNIGDSVIDTLEFDTANSHVPHIINISGDVFAVVYQGSGDDGFIMTVSISSGGQIGNGVINSFEFDAGEGREPDIVHVAGDVYAIAYRGPFSDGLLATMSIAADGDIAGPVIDSQEFDTESCYGPDMINVSGGVFAIAYQGPSSCGYIKTVGIVTGGGLEAAYEIVSSAGSRAVRAFVNTSGTAASIVSWRIE